MASNHGHQNKSKELFHKQSQLFGNSAYYEKGVAGLFTTVYVWLRGVMMMLLAK
jgi:hypothetical protein